MHVLEVIVGRPPFPGCMDTDDCHEWPVAILDPEVEMGYEVTVGVNRPALVLMDWISEGIIPPARRLDNTPSIIEG
jgi:hypothetical protein